MPEPQTAPSQVQVHPNAALLVVTRQNQFDHNEKMLMSGEVYNLQMTLIERDQRIKQLEAEVAGLKGETPADAKGGE